MKLADDDGDGTISLDEFKLIMRAGPSRPASPVHRRRAQSSRELGRGEAMRHQRSRGDVIAAAQAGGGGGEGGGGEGDPDDPLSGATHFLLLLNRKTFVGERGRRLAHTLRTALGLPDPDERHGLSAEEERAALEHNLFQACSHLKLELDRLKLSARASSSPSDLRAAAVEAERTLLRRGRSRLSCLSRTSSGRVGGAAGARPDASPPRQRGARGAERSRRSTRRDSKAVGDLMDKAVGDLGELLAEKSVSSRRIKLLLVHAVDAQDDGCEFDHFFSVTPSDLIHAGQLFHIPATPLFSSPAFRAVSIELVVATQRGLARRLAAGHPPTAPPTAPQPAFRWRAGLPPLGPRGKPSLAACRCCDGASSAPGACPHSPASPPLRTQGQLGPQRRARRVEPLLRSLLRRLGISVAKSERAAVPQHQQQAACPQALPTKPVSLLPIPARRAPPTSPTARTHPWQKAALVVQRVVRGFFSRKGLMTMITSRTAAAITIQRMQRGHAVRHSLARARSSSGGGGGGGGGGGYGGGGCGSSQPPCSSAPAAAPDAAAPERSCRDDQSGGPALETAAAATLVVPALPLMQVDARVAQSPRRDSLDALGVQARSPTVPAKGNALDNAMQRLGPEALGLGGALRPRPRPPYISRV